MLHYRNITFLLSSYHLLAPVELCAMIISIEQYVPLNDPRRCPLQVSVEGFLLSSAPISCAWVNME